MHPASLQFVDLRRQYQELQPEMDAALLRAVGRGDFILGEDTQEFEKEFAAFNQVGHCVGVGDGTDALHLALRALNIGPGDEVIVPTHTYIASVLAISNTGARPVLVDCEPDYYCMDVKAVERALTPRTKALMPVHLYGHPADMDPLLQIAKDRQLAIVEDTAQGHGATYKGRLCGTMGDIGCFSFYPGKNLGAYGDGGAIVTNRPELAERVCLLRNYGQKVKYVHTMKGYNSRLDTVQAAVLRVKLRHLARWNDQRRAAAARYTNLLAGTKFGLPKAAPWANPVWHLYVAQTDRRAELQKALDVAGIAHGIHYPIPVHLQVAYQDLGHKPGDFPVAEALADRILSLPMFPELTVEESHRVAQACAGL
ncbi:MAG: DegT/DnrJ/EryC1/StrS family aminotransferase [Gammaproteobacteria bacterium]|nr:DegT/DnrJ/EryC1/StrS family aminotransferase [Gammaproteobacteria bacterium]